MVTPVPKSELGTGLLYTVRSGLAATGRRARNALRLTLRTWAGRIGLPIVLFHLTLTLIGPWLGNWLPHSPTEFNYDEAVKVQFAGLDGSGVADLEPDLRPEPKYMALDVAGGKMYGTDGGTDKVQRANLDGSAVEDLVSGLSSPEGIALDVAGGKMYWTDSITDKVQRANLDGSAVEDLVSGLSSPEGIALDVAGGKMYWTDEVGLEQLLSPSWQFWLGTDQYGRDILSRVLTGATSLVMTAAAGAGLGIVLGTVVGISSGYKGGRVDEVVMRVMDGLMSFPTLLLALLVLFTLGTSRVNIAATIGFVSMPSIARVVRSTTLSLKSMEFIQSARLRGEPAAYTIFREILPNVMPVLGVEASVRLSYSILSVASLSFLGLGIQPPSPDWGLAISFDRRFLISAPWIAIAPMVAVASLVIGVNLLADGLRQASGLAREEDRP